MGLYGYLAMFLSVSCQGDREDELPRRLQLAGEVVAWRGSIVESFCGSKSLL